MSPDKIVEKGNGEIQTLINRAVQFFQKEQGFTRLFSLFADKYRGLGRIGGSVRLVNLTKQEKEALSMLFPKDYRKQSSAIVSIESFEQALNKTKFAGIDLKEFLDAYFGRDILTRAESQEIYRSQKECFFQELEQKYAHLYCRQWLRHVQKKGAGTRGIHQSYDQNAKLLKKHLINVLSALAQLPYDRTSGKGCDEFLRLPVFSYNICQDPHGFDPDTEQGRFLISALQFLRHREDDAYLITSSLSAEEKTELMEYFGIVRDDILNFVTCTGIAAFDKNNEVLPMWKWAVFHRNVINVPIREIVKVNKFMPAAFLQVEDKNNVVFVMENSGVFSAVLDCINQTCRPPMICTHGQFKLATLLMLDLLVQRGTVIYYSGDFDPEGLQMAQRLYQRYPGQVILWHYEPEDYADCLSLVTVSEGRLKKLQGITIKELQPVKEMMLLEKKAGYQEQLISKLAEDIEDNSEII